MQSQDACLVVSEDDLTAIVLAHHGEDAIQLYVGESEEAVGRGGSVFFVWNFLLWGNDAGLCPLVPNPDNRVGGGHAHEPKGRGSTPPTGTNINMCNMKKETFESIVKDSSKTRSIQRKQFAENFFQLKA